MLLFDPQTSADLLLGVPRQNLDSFLLAGVKRDKLAGSVTLKPEQECKFDRIKSWLSQFFGVEAFVDQHRCHLSRGRFRVIPENHSTIRE